MFPGRPAAGGLGLGLGHVHLIWRALQLLHRPALLPRHLVALAPVLCVTLLLWNLRALLHILALLYRYTGALLLGCAVAGGAVRRLGLGALFLVAGVALLLIPALGAIHRAAVLVRDLLAVIVVESAALLPGHHLAIVPGGFGVVGLLASVAFLALLPLHIAILLDVYLPAFLIGNLLAGLARDLLALLVVGGPALLLRHLHTTLHVLAVLLGNVLAALAVGRLAQLVRYLFAFLRKKKIQY